MAKRGPVADKTQKGRMAGLPEHHMVQWSDENKQAGQGPREARARPRIRGLALGGLGFSNAT